MKDPVICADGQSYDHEFIEAWLRDHSTSPVTNLTLPNKDLLKNHALRNSIEEWLRQIFKTVPRTEISLGQQIGSGAFCFSGGVPWAEGGGA